jgi:hypothetical protein
MAPNIRICKRAPMPKISPGAQRVNYADGANHWGCWATRLRFAYLIADNGAQVVEQRWVAHALHLGIECRLLRLDDAKQQPGYQAPK